MPATSPACTSRARSCPTVRCGAQDPEVLVDVDLDLVDALVAAAGGGLLHMTFAPERDPSGSLPAALSGHGVVGSLGAHRRDHATCAPSPARRPRWRRPRRSPPSASSTVCRRCTTAPGPVAAALGAAARGEAVVELIADGVHLDERGLQLVFDTVGPSGIALVSDAMSASGLPEGDSLGGRWSVPGPRSRGPAGGRRVAGGVEFDTARPGALQYVGELGVDLVDAVTAAYPARALSLGGVGSLSAGFARRRARRRPGPSPPARAASRHLALTPKARFPRRPGPSTGARSRRTRP